MDVLHYMEFEMGEMILLDLDFSFVFLVLVSGAPLEPSTDLVIGTIRLLGRISCHKITTNIVQCI